MIVVEYLRKTPLFSFLLILFFVFHGFVENYPIVPIRESALLLLFYLGIALVLFLIGWIIYRQVLVAFFFCFIVLFVQFFFGPIQDTLRSAGPLAFLAKYSFLIPLCIVLIVLPPFLLKRRGKGLRLTLFLNTLLLVLLVIDLGQLIKARASKTSTRFIESLALKNCGNCNKPDIYLIIADGYAGQKELRDLFGYQNQQFLQALEQRGFFIADSIHSNYNFTYFSLASMLNMDFLPGINGSNSNKNDQKKCNAWIRDNAFTEYLRSEGYDIYNHSIFDLHGEPSIAEAAILPLKTKLITRQTFTNRIVRDLGYHLVTTLGWKTAINKIIYSSRKNNIKAYEHTLEVARKDNNKPRFVFTHLMMPHFPYYYDSTGKENSSDLLANRYAFSKDLYLSYLKYCNTRLVSLVDSIRQKNKNKIILLLSDHGFRELPAKTDTTYYYNNFTALYLPSGNYNKYYKGISPVNLFRILMNNEFGQQLPLLPDSTFFIRE